MGRETGYGFPRIYLEENASEKTYAKNCQLNLYGLIEGKERRLGPGHVLALGAVPLLRGLACAAG